MAKIHYAECWKHDLCRALPVRVKQYMRGVANVHRDRDTDEINATTLAEDAAHHFDHTEWLDDPSADVWTWAVGVAGPPNL